MVDLNIMRQTLMPEQVLEPGSAEYEKAVFIGNLNYRFTTPAAVIRAKSTNDVVSTVVDFARVNGIRLTVKNGGHSYMGYCLNRGGIVLDLSLMNTCHIDYDKMLIHMDSGLVWKDVYYKYLKDKRNIVIGGQCPTVGVSGFTLGVGLSPFSRKNYGLRCDNLLEMTIVTWDGQVVTVSREDKDAEKQELFWALAGGGGGNFGVTVGLKSRMHKLRDQEGKVACGQLKWRLPQDKDERLQHYQVALIGGMTVIYNGGLKKAQEVLEPLLEFKPFKNDSKVYHHHASFIFAEGAITPEVTAKISNLVEEATRVVGITDNNEVNDPKCHILWDHIGAETEQIASDETPFPWRKGHYVSTLKVQWADETKQNDMEFVCKCKAELLPYAIDKKAAYINYIDATVADWQEAYYVHEPLESEEDQALPPNGNTTDPNNDDPPPVKVDKWWKECTPLVTPGDLESLKTNQEVFERDVVLREHVMKSMFQ
ncbi:hypothetical protein CSUB01_05893 [Colletotrichum sublineola]|uniref:FAD-binding PCMH-type domain-containing protein n=1 Tax=Colletotrichum sublineola TaxID=1173701 RepID=A0A066XME3_COLSU|nr:hypothetical protein CSUB01_05893 [Colletotrichum sublineola]